jgi:hypothetical protein
VLLDYSAADQAWVTDTDLNRFIANCAPWRRVEQGQATLSGASPDDLRLEFYSTIYLVMRRFVDILANNAKGFLLQPGLVLTFEP